MYTISSFPRNIWAGMSAGYGAESATNHHSTNEGATCLDDRAGLHRRSREKEGGQGEAWEKYSGRHAERRKVGKSDWWRNSRGWGKGRMGSEGTARGIIEGHTAALLSLSFLFITDVAAHD